MADDNQTPRGFSKEEREWIKAQREREAERQKREALRGGGDDSDSVNINSLMDIMVIILVFLLKSYGEEPIKAVTDDIKVPASTSQLEPADSLTIAIQRQRLLVNDNTVVDLQDGELDPSHLSGDGELRIEPLLESLNDAVESEKSQAEWTGEDWEPEATVIADQTTRHRLILEVLYTATEAELTQFRFAVIQSASETIGGVEQAGAEI